MKVIDQHPYALKEPAPVVKIGEYKERSVSMQIWVWSKNEYFYDLNDDLWVAVRDIFKEQNIKIPSQQIDVHIQQNDIKS